MKKILLLTLVSLLLFSASGYPNRVQAGSDLHISANSDYSILNTEFSPGETVYVKVTANSEGKTKKELNLRDNQYQLISTHGLNYLGNNTFQGSLTAPANSGTYSLETRIESEGSVSTSVKTIKVGSASSKVNVKVNVQSNGQNVLGNSQTPTPNPSPTASPSTTSSPSIQPQHSPDSEIKAENENIFERISSFFKKLFEKFF